MGAQQPTQGPPKPEPTMKGIPFIYHSEQVKEYVTQINQTRREQQREKFKI